MYREVERYGAVGMPCDVVYVELAEQVVRLLVGEPRLLVAHAEDIQQLCTESKHILRRQLRVLVLPFVEVGLHRYAEMRLHLRPCRRVALVVVDIRHEDGCKHSIVRLLSSQHRHHAIELSLERPVHHLARCSDHYHERFSARAH